MGKELVELLSFLLWEGHAPLLCKNTELLMGIYMTTL